MLSRVADSLYWMSRYLERAEHTARVLDLTLNMLLERRSDEAMKEQTNRLLESLYVSPLEDGAGLYELTNALAFDRTNEVSIVSNLELARENARQVREQISSEMWEHLNTLYYKIKRKNLDEVWNAQGTHNYFRRVKEGVQLFQGLTDSTLSRNESWQFINLGCYIERTDSISHFLDVQFRALKQSPDYPAITKDYMEWVGLLKCLTAFEAYCKTYTANLRPERIAEFLILNSEFPHSIHFAVDKIDNALNAIEKLTATTRAVGLNGMIETLKSSLSETNIGEAMNNGLGEFLKSIQSQCDKIHEEIYNTYITYSIETAFAV
jgi:uncharacterized alpha-E superfamily protein